MKYSRYIILLLTLVILFTPLALVGRHHVIESENRELAPLPQIKKDAQLNSAFFKELNAWYNDHFGLRSWFLGLHTTLQRNLRRPDYPVVLVGKGKWLFYKGDKSIPKYQGLDLLTPQQLETISDNLRTFNQELKRQGTHFVLFITADKNSIYGDFYPNYIKKIADKNRTDQILEHLKTSAPEVHIIDTRPLLMAKRQTSDRSLYYTNDTHWNDLGAFYGTQYLLQSIAPFLKTSPELNLSDYQISVKTGYEGDLARLSGDPARHTYGLSVELDPHSPYQYSPILRCIGVHTKEHATQHADTTLPKAYVVRDSFMASMAQYLSNSFSAVEYRHINNGAITQEELEGVQSDVFIYQTVERSLPTRGLNHLKISPTTPAQGNP